MRLLRSFEPGRVSVKRHQWQPAMSDCAAQMQTLGEVGWLGSKEVEGPLDRCLILEIKLAGLEQIGKRRQNDVFRKAVT